MSPQPLFSEPEYSADILLIYDADQSIMPAKDLGEALLGMEVCLKKIGQIALIDFDSVYISPLEEGSIKTKFRYIKKHPWTVLNRINIIATLLISSLTFIDHFGSVSFSSPTKQILEAISDKRILHICESAEFRNGLGKIAQPITQYNKSAKIIITDKSFEINCENKYKFENNQEEVILPELINGETITLSGEITRINKTNNDLGFSYKGHVLSVIPLEENKRTTEFHQYLALDHVLLKGVVFRQSDYENPKIKVITIEPIKKDEQKQLFP